MIKTSIAVFVGGLAAAIAFTQVPAMYKEHKQKERENAEWAQSKKECRANPDHYWHYLSSGIQFVSADKYDRWWSNYGVPCRETTFLKYKF